jgi:hypothetical protein
MREVSAHAQNDNRSVAAEIFAIGTYFPNRPRIIAIIFTYTILTIIYFYIKSKRYKLKIS